jgi:hypothetical protein
LLFPLASSCIFSRTPCGLSHTRFFGHFMASLSEKLTSLVGCRIYCTSYALPQAHMCLR